jgi:anti-sigma regulatory factor (Ser/Thr protein kinase)
MAIARNGHCVQSVWMSTTTSRSCGVQLTCDLAAPRTARHLVALLLRQWGVHDQEVVDSATIVVSELVTNVLVHCDDGGPVQLALELRDEQLRVSVEDRTPVVPRQREAAPADENGRGLGIVAQLATHWEVLPLSDGKRVVVDLPLPTAWCA